MALSGNTVIADPVLTAVTVRTFPPSPTRRSPSRHPVLRSFGPMRGASERIGKTSDRPKKPTGGVKEPVEKPPPAGRFGFANALRPGMPSFTRRHSIDRGLFGRRPKCARERGRRERRRSDGKRNSGQKPARVGCEGHGEGRAGEACEGET